VAKAVSTLRKRILGTENHAYMGSEDQLLAELGISRPTLRQAVRLLEHERLLVIKRGSKGGFYARRPQIEAVAHAAAIYLAIEHATTADIFAVSAPLVREAIGLAATARAPEMRQRLADLLHASGDGRVAGIDGGHVFKADVEMIRIVVEMCGNPVLKLFISIIYEFGAAQWADLLERGHLPEISQMRSQIIRAILESDAELAVLYSQRRADRIFELLNKISR
jgi:GntR family transcriptional repressor for pyruvate dehydrogenase complex